jgi:putative sporulation protein YyaC
MNGVIVANKEEAKLVAKVREFKPIIAFTDDHKAKIKIVNKLSKLFVTIEERPVVIMCIGTDRSTGDSLGPLVGMQLMKQDLPQFYVYGSLDEPIHAENLQKNIEFIQDSFVDPFIIAVDACLGKLNHVGSISLGYGPIKPGAGVKKELPEIGHIYLKAIVNVGGFMEFMVLQNTRLSLTWKLAENICSIIIEAYLKAHDLKGVDNNAACSSC